MTVHSLPTSFFFDTGDYRSAAGSAWRRFSSLTAANRELIISERLISLQLWHRPTHTQMLPHLPVSTPHFSFTDPPDNVLLRRCTDRWEVHGWDTLHNWQMQGWRCPLHTNPCMDLLFKAWMHEKTPPPLWTHQGDWSSICFILCTGSWTWIHNRALWCGHTLSHTHTHQTVAKRALINHLIPII